MNPTSFTCAFTEPFVIEQKKNEKILFQIQDHSCFTAAQNEQCVNISVYEASKTSFHITQKQKLLRKRTKKIIYT